MSGGPNVRVFFVGSGAELTLNNLTVANGNTGSGGGIINAGGTLTVKNSTFIGNHGTDGGGIFNRARLR